MGSSSTSPVLRSPTDPLSQTCSPHDDGPNFSSEKLPKYLSTNLSFLNDTLEMLFDTKMTKRSSYPETSSISTISSFSKKVRFDSPHVNLASLNINPMNSLGGKSRKVYTVTRDDQEYVCKVFYVKNRMISCDLLLLYDNNPELIQNDLDRLLSLRHENINRVLATSKRGEGIIGYIEEKCAYNMSWLISTNQNLSFLTKIKVIQQLLNGLNFLHEKKIVHQNLNWNNVMLTKTGVIKIIDVMTPSMSSQNESFLYIAPETLDNSPMTPKSNVYSLGMMIYEILIDEIFPVKRIRKLANKAMVGSLSSSWSLKIIKEENLRPEIEILEKVVEKAKKEDIDVDGLKIETLGETLKLMIEDCWGAYPDKRPTVSKLASRLL